MMVRIKKTIFEYKSFFYLYFTFLVIAGLALVIFSKEETFFFVNSRFSSMADFFFRGITGLGDGLFFALITLVLAIYRYRLALMGLVIFLSSSLVAQVLKNTLFSGFKRPYGVFGDDSRVHLVEGVAIYVKNSFPSGHTTTAFALAVFLVLAFGLKRSGWLLALAAMLVGYSRVYLAQHFPVDVYYGSLIGVITCLVMYSWLDQPLRSRFGDKGLMANSKR